MPQLWTMTLLCPVKGILWYRITPNFFKKEINLILQIKFQLKIHILQEEPQSLIRASAKTRVKRLCPLFKAFQLHLLKESFKILRLSKDWYPSSRDLRCWSRTYIAALQANSLTKQNRQDLQTNKSIPLRVSKVTIMFLS